MAGSEPFTKKYDGTAAYPLIDRQCQQMPDSGIRQQLQLGGDDLHLKAHCLPGSKYIMAPGIQAPCDNP